MENENVCRELKTPHFDTLKYDIFVNNENILLDDSCDPDRNFFSTHIQNINTPYILPDEFDSFLDTIPSQNFSILHLNIRSAKKNFESFKELLVNLNTTFSIICFSETWLNTTDIGSSLYELPQYKSIHQIRNHSKGGGVSIYIHENLSFKVRNDLSVNCMDVESLSVEV